MEAEIKNRKERMAFTFSHPALVLPLTLLPKKWFSLTGLIIGSLAPDFEYFFRMKIVSNYSHTLGGLFWFDLPLTILLAFLFHNIVRDSLYDNFPSFLKSRFSVYRKFDWNGYFSQNWLVVIISALIGAASHILWDSFTHDNGYFVQSLPQLSNTIDLLGHQMTYSKILQHSSTLLGGLVIVLVIFTLPKNKVEKEKVDWRYWAILLLLSFIIIGVRIVCGLDPKQYGNVIVTAISAGQISLVLTPLLLKINPKHS